MVNFGKICKIFVTTARPNIPDSHLLAVKLICRVGKSKPKFNLSSGEIKAKIFCSISHHKI